MKYTVTLWDQPDQTVEADEFLITEGGILFFESVEGVYKTDKGLGWSVQYPAKRDTVACYNQGTWRNVRKDGESKGL